MGRFSVFNRPKFDLQGEIRELQDELVVIAGLRGFLVSEAGKRLIAAISQRITNYDESIVALAERPEKNADEMRLKRCLGECYRGLLSILETTAKQEPDTKARLNKCEETAKKAALQRR